MSKPSTYLYLVLAALVLTAQAKGLEIQALETKSKQAKAQETAKLLFEDNFDRNESQEVKEELGNGWSTNSAKRAKGNKQADLIDGSLFFFRHETADHGVSLVHAAEYKDCRVELRFRLDHAKDELGLDFADMECKEVHAGHICKTIFRRNGVKLIDYKLGSMNKAIHTARKAGTLTEEQKAETKKRQRELKAPIELKKWHSAVVTIKGDVMSVRLDGKHIGSFSSAGIGHPQKDKIRFAGRREVWMDDVKMYALSPASASKAESHRSSTCSLPHLCFGGLNKSI